MILKFCLTDFSTSLEFEITKKPITIFLVSNSQQYTGDTITPQINSFQLVGEDDVQVSLEPNAPLVEIGDYTLALVVSGQDADNYQFTLANNQFTITKATPIENADFDGEIEYGKTYTITISANGNYQGQTSFTFTINDPSPSGLDPTILIIIIVCAVVVLLLIILTIILVVRHKKKIKQQTIANANN